MRSRAAGVVRRTLTGRRGETNGVILDDGTVVRLPPHVGEAFANILVPGTRLVARGYGSSGPTGTALEAVALGSSEGAMTSVGSGGPRPRRGVWAFCLVLRRLVRDRTDTVGTIL